MSTSVPLYGSGVGGGAGATLTVTAPAGAIVTVSKDGKSKTKVANDEGVAVFRGLKSGIWTVTITDGTNTASRTVAITTEYYEEMSYNFVLFDGVNNVDNTGGWTFSSADTSASSYSIGDTLKFTCNPPDYETINYVATLTTKNAISNDGYTKLCISYVTAKAYKGNEENQALWVKDALGEGFNVQWTDLDKTNWTQEIDIAGLAEFKLQFGSHPWYPASLNSGCDIEVSKIWLE